jgi:hypothetical protein
MRIFSAVFGGILGLLLLVKGTGAALLLLLVAAMYLGLNGSLPAATKLNLPYLSGSLAVVLLPWLAWVSLQTHRPLFASDYLLTYPFQRMTASGWWQGLQFDPLFYIRKLPVGLMPYILFIPALIWDYAVTIRRGGSGIQPWQNWLAAWFGLGLLACSLCMFKEPSLILPFFPPVMILLGDYLGRMTESVDGTPAYRNTMALFLIATMAMAVLITILVFQVLPSNYPVGFWHLPGKAVIPPIHLGKKIELPEFPIWKLWLVPAPFILMVGGLVAFVQQLLRRHPQCVMALIGTTMAFLLFVKAIFLPVLHRPVPEVFAGKLNHQVTQRDKIVLYSLHPDVKRVLFYLSPSQVSRTRFMRRPADMQTALNADRHAIYGVIREGSFFDDLDYSYRNLLRVDRADWKWDTSRLGELRKLLIVRKPNFEKMRSEMLYFQSLPPGNSMDMEAVLAPDPANRAAR